MATHITDEFDYAASDPPFTSKIGKDLTPVLSDALKTCKQTENTVKKLLSSSSTISIPKVIKELKKIQPQLRRVRLILEQEQNAREAFAANFVNLHQKFEQRKVKLPEKYKVFTSSMRTTNRSKKTVHKATVKKPTNPY